MKGLLVPKVVSAYVLLFLFSAPAFGADRYLEFSSMEEARAFAGKMSVVMGYRNKDGSPTTMGVETKTADYTVAVKHPKTEKAIVGIMEKDFGVLSGEQRRALKSADDVREFYQFLP
ncbi:MAG: hypothetical protein KGZ69_05935 [Methylomonas sp.]|nr:hypothetical protein [Methylomonas sp.]